MSLKLNIYSMVTIHKEPSLARLRKKPTTASHANRSSPGNSCATPGLRARTSGATSRPVASATESSNPPSILLSHSGTMIPSGRLRRARHTSTAATAPTTNMPRPMASPTAPPVPSPGVLLRPAEGWAVAVIGAVEEGGGVEE